MSLSDLPTLSDRPRMACQKGKTRLEVTVTQRPLTKVDEKAFRTDVWTRDKGHCRCCLRKVIRILDRVPERGEVHHIHGRGKDLRFEARAALLLCLTCHERITGKVNAHRLIVVATKTFTMRGETFTDARSPVVFKETA